MSVETPTEFCRDQAMPNSQLQHFEHRGARTKPIERYPYPRMPTFLAHAIITHLKKPMAFCQPTKIAFYDITLYSNIPCARVLFNAPN